MKSNMKKDYASISKANINRSAFNRTHSYKTMFDVNKIVPFCVEEVIPGDQFSVNATLLARLSSPLQLPMMDNLNLETFWFFCPSRLIDNNFKKLMGEQVDPGDSIDFTIPVVTAPSGGHLVESMADYFGIPINTEVDVNAHPFRAYNLIYNEWFRDQNLQDSLTVNRDAGPDLDTDYSLKTICKRHDYFTSCLPFAQKGDAIPLPLSGDAPISGIGMGTQSFASYTSKAVYETDGTGTVVYANAKGTESASNNQWFAEEDTNNTGFPNIRADLSAATGATINEFREAMQLQKFQEMDARGGTRYTEIIRSHFNVTSPDARLQRPEFLGGNSTPITINPVTQTGETNTTPQANLSAYGVANTSGSGFSKSFTEHGYIIGLVSSRADLTYQKGLDKLWSRSTRYDFFWPEFAHLGEQAVLNKEIYAQGDANDDLVFGYQERYAEYRSKNSKITGKMNSHYATSLDNWHLSQEFSSLPTLSDTFIKETTPIDRVLAVTTEPDFVLDSYIKIKAIRPIPTYGTPGLGNRM